MGKFSKFIFMGIAVLLAAAGNFVPKQVNNIAICPDSTSWDTLKPMNYNTSHSVVLSDKSGDTTYFHIIGGYANDTTTSRVLRYNSQLDTYDTTVIPPLPVRVAGGLGFTLGDSMYYGGGVNPSWAVQTSPVSDTYFDITYPSASTGYIGTTIGRVLKTTNNGASWSSIFLDSSRDIKSVQFTSDAMGWALASSDTSIIYKTTNGGSSWTSNIFFDRLNQLTFTSPTAWAGGNGGAVYKTTNSGTTWSLSTTGFSTKINSITGSGTTLVWAACDSGKVTSSTNGGTTWTQIPISTSNLKTIKFINASTGFAGGENGSFYRSSNGGANWSFISLGTNQAINDIEFLGDTSIAVVGDGGVIISSKDFGINWERRRGVTREDISAIAGEGISGLTTIIGSPGMIIKSSKGCFEGFISNQLYKLNLMSPGSGWVLRDSIPLPLTDVISNCEEMNDSLAYVVGGRTNGNITLNHVYRYNGKTNAWTKATSLPDSLSLGGFAGISDTTIIFAGGRNFTSISSAIYYGTIKLQSGMPDTIVWVTGPSYPTGPVYGMASAGIRELGVGLFVGGSTNLFPEFPTEDAFLITDSLICPVSLTIPRVVAKPIVTSGTDEGGKGETIEGIRGTDTTYYSFHLFGGIEDSVSTSNNLNRKLSARSIEVSIENISTEIPGNYSLLQNFPNPFNPSTSIIYEIPKNGFVSLRLYDIAGREVAVLVNENQHPGTYRVNFNSGGLSSGIYFYRLRSGTYTESRRMVLIK